MRAPDAIESALMCYIDLRREIPVPRATNRGPFVTLPALTEAKLALYTVMRTAKIGEVELARRLNCHEVATPDAGASRPVDQRREEFAGQVVHESVAKLIRGGAVVPNSQFGCGVERVSGSGLGLGRVSLGRASGGETFKRFSPHPLFQRALPPATAMPAPVFVWRHGFLLHRAAGALQAMA